MDTLNRIILNVIFCIQVLLVFLLFVQEQVMLPPWLQVAGRLHPLVLHLPIGFIIFLVVILLLQKQFDETSIRQIIHIGLLITSLSASLAALFGFFLSLQDEYGADALMRHKISGVTLSWLCYAALLWNNQRRKKALFWGFGAFTVVTLIIAGHTGSVLTHGENFLMAPISESSELTVDNASVYQFAVQPILEKKCFSCHNAVKAKGGLVMTSVDKFKEGGKKGKEWVEGKPEESRMIKAFYLPLSHDEHMPPDGKPQLTAVEIATLEAWIKSGADFEKKLNQFEDGDSLKFIVASFLAAQTSAPVEEKQYAFKAVSSDAVDKLNSPFRSVFPLYQNSPALQADFFLKESFQIKTLEELKSIKDQLVVLNLSKMPVTDKDLEIISSFKNLEILNLNFTRIEGNGLSSLQSLTNLQSLSLSGVPIHAKDLEPVFKLPQLLELYIWSTKITDAEREVLSKRYPNIKIVGNLFVDDGILKLGKPTLENEAIIRKGELVSLSHNMPGVKIRFSLDGKEPDSLKGKTYEEPFPIQETVPLKAKACKDNWYCSDVYEVTCYVQGFTPERVELLNAPDPQYPGEGSKSLTDLRKGFADNFKEPSWLGYRNKPFAASFDFGNDLSIKTIVISYGKNIGGYILPPDEVEIWAGNDLQKFILLKKEKINQPSGNGPVKVEPLLISTNSKEAYRFYKVIAKPVAKLPKWHDAKGEKAWFFIDEIFFY